MKNITIPIQKVKICALNHHFSPIYSKSHEICEKIANSNLDTQSFIELKANCAKWTIFPYKLNNNNISNLLDITFNVNTSYLEGCDLALKFCETLEQQFLNLTSNTEKTLSVSCIHNKCKNKHCKNNITSEHTGNITENSKDNSSNINPDFLDIQHLFDSDNSSVNNNSSILYNILTK